MMKIEENNVKDIEDECHPYNEMQQLQQTPKWSFVSPSSVQKSVNF